MNENLWSLALIASLNFALLMWLWFRPVKLRTKIRDLKIELARLDERDRTRDLYNSFGSREHTRLLVMIEDLKTQVRALEDELRSKNDPINKRGSTHEN